MATEGLDTPVQFLKGVGPQRAKVLGDLGIATVRDLLDVVPHRYRFYDAVGSIADLQIGQNATVVGYIEHTSFRRFPRPSKVAATISDDRGACVVQWFNCPYIAERLAVGRYIRARGKVAMYRDQVVMTNPQFELFDEFPGRPDDAQSQPQYPDNEIVGVKTMSNLTHLALETFGTAIDDWLSDAFRKKRDLVHRREAYERIHRPSDINDWLIGRRRLAYDELFFMQLGMLMARRRRARGRGMQFSSSDEIDRRIRSRFPFPLTDAQNRAISDILADLTSGRPMCRLVQGDVGCGKTVVALYAALVTIANHRQVALMAPTEILAQQHYRKFIEFLAGSKVRVEMLVGKTTAKRRREILAEAADGKIDLLIGTHALIEDAVGFKKLGLVVIDEQHKFGVHQRADMQAKAAQPHYLVMTATPIPRSLALTVFGDLDLSVIDASPPGRLPTRTEVFASQLEDEVWRRVNAQLDRGDQAYIVYPLLEESDKLELKSATAQAERLSTGVFASRRVGLIHGKLKPAEKQAVMDAFKSRQLDVLVATVVIEVGIDVPDANVLVVEHAERFGLAQLHQLRGRVGRAGGQGYCYLIAQAKSENAKRRLNVLLDTTNGFKIAEEDLKIRGPGQFFGTAQHGLTELKLADLIEDYDMLVQARTDAEQLLNRDADLSQHTLVRKEVMRRLGRQLKLIDAA